MSISFNFGEHFYHNDSSLFIQGLMVFIGAFLAFLSALLINYILENNKIKNRALLLKNLFQLIIKSGIKQLENIAEFSENLEKKPTEIHKLGWQASYNIKRYLNIDSQELFQLFKKLIKQKKRLKGQEGKIDLFTQINAKIDYFDMNFHLLKLSVEEYTSSTYKRLLIVKDYIENISTTVAIILEELKMEHRDSDVFIFLNQKLNIKHSLDEKGASIIEYINFYIISLIDGIYLNKYHIELPRLYDVLKSGRSSKLLLKDVELDSLNLSNDLKSTNEQLGNNFEELKILISKVLPNEKW